MSYTPDNNRLLSCIAIYNIWMLILILILFRWVTHQIITGYWVALMTKHCECGTLRQEISSWSTFFYKKIVWSIDWLIDWLNEWMIDWLSRFSVNLQTESWRSWKRLSGECGSEEIKNLDRSNLFNIRLENLIIVSFITSGKHKANMFFVTFFILSFFYFI